MADNFRVVCVAGSAGGLQAYLSILRNLPADTGMSFVVAAHRGLDQAHLLPNILARATTMPVVEVAEGMRLAANQVFLMPPGKEMTIKGDEFILRIKQKKQGWPITINLFLFSLAEEYRHRAVAVILSGVDHDGSAALKAIKAAGGVTFAQSNPVFDDMPRHAIETGHVDFILAPTEIAKALLDLNHEVLSSAAS
jgi:two-component system, chemotaxis family, CheB/CheR fusion protein